MYLLDTNHVTCWQYANSAEYDLLRTRLKRSNDLDVFVSIVSFHEEIVGWNKYLARAKNSPSLVKAYSKFEQILQDFGRMQLLPFDQKAVWRQLVFRSVLPHHRNQRCRWSLTRRKSTNTKC